MGLGTAGIRCHGQRRNTVGLCTAGILCCRALQEYSPLAVGHYCAGSCYWALQGYLVVVHCRDTLHLGSAGIRCHGHRRNTVRLITAGMRRCRNTLRLLSLLCCLLLGTAGILCGWWLGIAGTKILCGCALQGYVAIEHCRDTWWLGTAGIPGG